jgi:branched-subunit amino acid ABC-type transport system permease component
MVGMLGHNVPRVFMMVFGLGTALAAIAGVIAGAAYVTQSNMAALLGPILFVVVVVGGLGSLWGAFVASLLIGLLQTFAIASDWSLNKFFGDFITPTRGTLLFDIWNVTIAQIGPILPYLLLVLVLIFRPTGLFGTQRNMSDAAKAMPMASETSARARIKRYSIWIVAAALLLVHALHLPVRRIDHDDVPDGHHDHLRALL